MNTVHAGVGQDGILVPPLPRPDVARWVLGTVVVGVVLAAAWATVQGGAVVNWDGWVLARRFLAAAFAPAHDVMLLELATTAICTTTAYAICGSAISVTLGTVGGVLGSEAWWDVRRSGDDAQLRNVSWPARTIRAGLAVPRGIHELVWGLFFINILGLDPLVAVLAIGIPFGATTAKVFAEIIDETPRRSARCFRIAGASTATAFAYGILPRAFPLLISYTLYRLECAIRSAAVLGLIGAGGLGYQMMLSLQSLRYDQVWTFLYGLILLVAITDWGSSKLSKSVTAQTASSERELSVQTRSIAVGAIVVVSAVVGSYFYLNLDASNLAAPRAMEMLNQVLTAAWPPRFAQGELSELAALGAETLAMSITAMAMAGPAAVLASWFSSPALFNVARGEHPPHARDYAARFLTICVRMGLICIRALSDGIWVLLALFFFYPGAFAGAFALAAYNLGVSGRLLHQVNESSDKKAFRALRAQGASFGRALMYGLLPTATPKYLAYVLYRWEVCLRATIVVGIVGAGGLGRRLEEQLASFDYSGVAATLAAFVVLTVLVDAVSSSGRKALSLHNGRALFTATDRVARHSAAR